MRIVHVVDYSMPQMGYQEFLLPKYNAAAGHEVIILTSDRYFPVPNYEDTWKEFLGPRIIGCKSEIIHGVQIERLKTKYPETWRDQIERLDHFTETELDNHDFDYIFNSDNINRFTEEIKSLSTKLT